MMANITLLEKSVKDVTECPICTEMFCNPKMLPCFHTFCLRCIEQYGKDKRCGDTMSCPMCRKEFQVPVGGFTKLGVNFFLEQLIAALSASGMGTREVVDCDVCLVGKQCKVAATSFCMECEENMCDKCYNIHRSMEKAKNHHLSPLGGVSSIKATGKNAKRNFCDKHPREEIKFFCHECEISFCTTCSIARHNKHNCCEIGEIADKHKNRFKMYSDDVRELLTNIKEQSKRINGQLKSFYANIKDLHKNIMERSEAIKQMVDRHTHNLLEKLNFQKSNILKTINKTDEELQRSVIICETFVNYCQKAIEESDEVQVVRIADELQTRVKEIKSMEVPAPSVLPRVEFIPSDLNMNTEQKNIVGNILGILLIFF